MYGNISNTIWMENSAFDLVIEAYDKQWNSQPFYNVDPVYFPITESATVPNSQVKSKEQGPYYDYRELRPLGRSSQTKSKKGCRSGY